MNEQLRNDLNNILYVGNNIDEYKKLVKKYNLNSNIINEKFFYFVKNLKKRFLIIKCMMMVFCGIVWK